MDKNHKETTQTSQIDANRRRLTKAGLAVPAVLGTLASKQVLGQTPFNCTKSGQVSGNASTHGPDVSCAELGGSDTYWRDNLSDTTTLFKAVGFSDKYWIYQHNINKPRYLIAQRVSKVIDSNYRPATLKEVLLAKASGGPLSARSDVYIFSVSVNGETGVDCNPPPNVPLGKAAVASYLSAFTNPNPFKDYPLTSSEVVEMFNKAIEGTLYTPADWVRSEVTWNASDVLCYLQLLYGGAPGGCPGLST